jgi:membrane associated rhomboid family serine protease
MPIPCQGGALRNETWTSPSRACTLIEGGGEAVTDVGAESEVGVEEWGREGRREPVFDLPGVLVAIVGLLLVVQAGREFLSVNVDDMVLGVFAFIPDRYLLDAGQPAYPGGWGAMVWTFFTYAALHGSWMHLLFNAVMLAAVGRAVVMRIGTGRFLALVAASAACGAAMHLFIEWGSPAPMIGASGVVFGVLGAALRFVFAGPWRPLPSAVAALANPRVRGFILALVVMNLILVVVGSGPFGGDGGTVAWGAHLGGFLPGYFGFALFDPPLRR